MKKQEEGEKSRRTLKVTSSRLQMMDAHKVLKAVKRSVPPLTFQEKATWLWQWWGSELKLPMEEANFRLERHGNKNLLLNIKALPEAGIRQTAKDWEARFWKALVDAKGHPSAGRLAKV